MMVRRDALDRDDPDHPCNYIKAVYDVRPEEYGVRRPEPEQMPSLSDGASEMDR